ncbi:MAG TPA: hypothetical protein VGW75_09420 [Solirubrobacteraceae bacterium]|nr:hypothetical protein [Solirubrobacteraceae bacterium]
MEETRTEHVEYDRRGRGGKVPSCGGPFGAPQDPPTISNRTLTRPLDRSHAQRWASAASDRTNDSRHPTSDEEVMSWQVLVGAAHWWADEGLRELGRQRYGEPRGKRSSDAPAAPTTIDEVRMVFAAQRRPWRLTAIFVESSPDGEATAIASWADGATAVLAGIPARQRVVGPNETWGDLALRRMLEPRAVEAFVPKPWSAEFRVPGGALDRDLPALPELVTLAADHYEVSYDGDLDVMTRWAAVLDGRIAQRVQLVGLKELSPALRQG